MTWEANGWKSIQTAPKDGTGIVSGWFDEFGNWHYRIAFWNGLNWMIASSQGQVCFPRYWQPLPVPPKKGET